jgi:hypothetical protein
LIIPDIRTYSNFVESWWERCINITFITPQTWFDPFWVYWLLLSVDAFLMAFLSHLPLCEDRTSSFINYWDCFCLTSPQFVVTRLPDAPGYCCKYGVLFYCKYLQNRKNSSTMLLLFFALGWIIIQRHVLCQTCLLMSHDIKICLMSSVSASHNTQLVGQYINTFLKKPSSSWYTISAQSPNKILNI